MKTNLTYYLVSLLTVIGMLTACTEDSTLLFSQEKKEGRVILSYTVDGCSIVATRAPEKGNQDRNENLVKELDLFIFHADNTTHIHVPATDEEYTDYNDPQDGKTYKVWDIGLSPDDIRNGDHVYLLANCHDAVSDVTTLDQLKDKTVTDLICNGKQDKFVMDGKVTIDETMRNDKDLHIQIDLKRAAAKVRLTFAENKDGYKPGWEAVSYCFCHYARTSTVLALDETEEKDFVNNLTLEDYPTATTFQPVANEDGTISIVYDDPNDTSKEYLVLYAYPNNWYSGNGNPNEDHLNVAPPIYSDRETRILLRAPFDGKLYYYDIPVNFRLPLNNDATDIKFENYKDLYRIQRNHIYDITVTIDRAGGSESEPVILPSINYYVVEWNEEEIKVPSFN